MVLQFGLVSLLAACAHAFPPSGIQWVAPLDKHLVRAPEASPHMTSPPSSAAEPSQTLTRSDQLQSPDEIQGVTAQTDGTIISAGTGWPRSALQSAGQLASEQELTRDSRAKALWELKEPSRFDAPAAASSSTSSFTMTTMDVSLSCMSMVVLGALSIGAWLWQRHRKVRVAVASQRHVPFGVDHGGVSLAASLTRSFDTGSTQRLTPSAIATGPTSRDERCQHINCSCCSDCGICDRNQQKLGRPTTQTNARGGSDSSDPTSLSPVDSLVALAWQHCAAFLLSLTLVHQTSLGAMAMPATHDQNSMPIMSDTISQHYRHSPAEVAFVPGVAEHGRMSRHVEAPELEVERVTAAHTLEPALAKEVTVAEKQRQQAKMLTEMLQARQATGQENGITFTRPEEWREQDIPSSAFVLFVGNSTGSSLESWCPDCTRALPVVLEVAWERGIALQIVGVGERDDWKLSARGQDNPFRVKYGLSGVPTLCITRGAGTMSDCLMLGEELERENDPKKMKAIVIQALESLQPRLQPGTFNCKDCDTLI